MRSPFFRDVLSGSLPLWIWAAQFAFCYVWAALACQAGRGAPLAVSVVAAIAVVLLLVRACRSDRRGLHATARGIGAVLALVAIVWGVMPLLVLPACRFA